jgi:Icc-related predicted phosphoesterase
VKIHQMSDLHLEFNNDFRVQNEYDADLLMLNGDICVAHFFTKSLASPKRKLADNALDFFEKASEAYPHVVYIPGNHEHYHGVYTETLGVLKEALAHLPNIYILNNDFVEIMGYKIIGATLWTDCDNGNPLVLEYLGGYLNDFKIIDYSKNPYKKFWPIDSVVDHRASVRYISQECENSDNVIVMSHHAPSELSIHSSYKDPMYYYGNRGYFSDLDQFIADRPNIKLWTHGHMHNNFDYMIGDTRVVCNPMGYHTENVQGFKKDNIIYV